MFMEHETAIKFIFNPTLFELFNWINLLLTYICYLYQKKPNDTCSFSIVKLILHNSLRVVKSHVKSKVSSSLSHVRFPALFPWSFVLPMLSQLPIFSPKKAHETRDFIWNWLMFRIFLNFNQSFGKHRVSWTSSSKPPVCWLRNIILPLTILSAKKNFNGSLKWKELWLDYCENLN